MGVHFRRHISFQTENETGRDETVGSKRGCRSVSLILRRRGSFQYLWSWIGAVSICILDLYNKIEKGRKDIFSTGISLRHWTKPSSSILGVRSFLGQGIGPPSLRLASLFLLRLVCPERRKGISQ